MKKNEKFISIPKFLIEPAPRGSELQSLGGRTGPAAFFSASGIDKLEPYTGRLVEMRDITLKELGNYLKKASPKAQADQQHCQQLREVLVAVQALIKKGELQENGGILGSANIAKLTVLQHGFENSVDFSFGRIVIAPLIQDLLTRDKELCAFTDVHNSKFSKTKTQS